MQNENLVDITVCAQRIGGVHQQQQSARSPAQHHHRDRAAQFGNDGDLFRRISATVQMSRGREDGSVS
jgi:hypothetical protein